MVPFLIPPLKKISIFSSIYIGIFFLSLHAFTLQYAHSSFLGQYMSHSEIGLLFAGASFVSIFGFFFIPHLLIRFGIYKTMLGVIFINYFASLFLVQSTTLFGVIPLWIIHFSFVPLIYFTFDIFLENETKKEEFTGRVRGIALTSATLAALSGPLILGFTLGDTNEYGTVFLISTFFLIPLFLTIAFRFYSFKDPSYHIPTFSTILNTLKKEKDIRFIFYAQILIRFFFGIMIIYLPLYLHTIIGFSWQEIGWILFIMLLPYLFIEIPSGVLADKVWGEKEMLIIGFVFISLTALSLVFLNTTENILIWASILFLGRIGAALSNTMSEIYFFKKVDATDTDTITLFRTLNPLGFILGSLTSGIILFFFSFSILWICISLIMLLGIFFGYKIKDTK
jgi:MFS family permease